MIEAGRNLDPVITVIVTVHRRTQYLAGALRSVLAQTYLNYEVILVDDSGCKMAAAICNHFAAEPSARILYLPNAETCGVAESVRRAIAYARGAYIAILNDDDEWEPDFLVTLVAPLERDGEIVCAFGDHWIMREDGRIDNAASVANTIKFGRQELPEGRIQNAAELILQRNAVPLAMAAIFRKDAMRADSLWSEAAGAYDFWIGCLLAASGRPFYYVVQRVSRYRVHKAMETDRRSHDKNENMVFIYDTLLAQSIFPDYERQLKRKLCEAQTAVGRDKLLLASVQDARRHFLRALRARVSTKPILGVALTFLPHWLLIWLHVRRRNC